MLGLCILTAACSDLGGPLPPTAPSGANQVTGAQMQAIGGPNIEVTFTKWVDPSFPLFRGVALFRGDDVPNEFAATVLERTAFDNGNIVDLRAEYRVIAADGARSFTVVIEGKQNNQTRHAVLNGTVTDSTGGWLTGARVHVAFDVIEPCPQYSKPRCFTGILRVLAGSAD
jgi:hypothetical protein